MGNNNRIQADATGPLRRFRQHATEHPYRTVGLAALAGLLLSNRSARALAGWAGLRLGWRILLGALRDGDERPAESTA